MEVGLYVYSCSRGHVVLIPCDPFQPKVFTASGGKNTGSLRTIRRGAGFDKLARFEGAGNFSQLFPLRARCDDAYASHVFPDLMAIVHVLDAIGTTSTFSRQMD